MCKNCVVIVFWLFKYCVSLFTGKDLFSSSLNKTVNNIKFFHISLADKQHTNPQDLLVFSLLFEQVFYPVSTTPIIIRTI